MDVAKMAIETQEMIAKPDEDIRRQLYAVTVRTVATHTPTIADLTEGRVTTDLHKHKSEDDDIGSEHEYGDESGQFDGEGGDDGEGAGEG